MIEHPWLDWLGDPTEHSFVPSVADAARCWACGELATEHPFELDYLERRRQEGRKRERYGRQEEGLA